MGKLSRILNKLARNSSWYNNVIFSDCKKFWSHSQYNLDVINLGSTSAKAAFNYSGLDIKAANWAMAPQTMIADFAILQNFYSYLKPEGATVILSLCPFSCFDGANEYIDDKYYTFLNISTIPYGNVLTKIKVNDIKNNPIKYFPLMEIFKMLRRHKDVTFSEEDMKRRSEVYLNSWKREFSLSELDSSFNLLSQYRFDATVSLLKDIVQYCDDRSIRLAIVIPPMYSTLSMIFTDNFKKQYIESCVYKSCSSGMYFHNYMDDEDFRDISLYKDPLLLNPIGAKKFTERVLKDLGLL